MFHTGAKLVLEGDPREVREFHVALLQDGERLLTEHDLLREHHVRDERRLFLTHTAARHRDDGELVDEPAVPCLEVTEAVTGEPRPPTGEQRIDDKDEYPERDGAE